MKLELVNLVRRAALVLCACASLNGCLSSTPIWDAHVGQALKAVTQAQIIDPDAGHTPDKPSMDGTSAVTAMDSYDKSFRSPTPPSNAFVIGVGSGSAVGGQ
ncbi:MAG: hypothetical protein EPN70_04185 [Paraburkholderia sp.]|uniref:hypothetical protein n=1 Tax=Paraburkholderia sp. TaxID=1926495 RepID=UPI00121E2002|nr:hypothetical protein [Paraburkholderia sp.]TAM06969.1 MAG: hypothetical protein EPN70_04185 [Paraburkholderia sp.]TAM31963.1 MAG: hypothetical protein EPN59_03215 [Paraburkholderia sp.]